jgi:hypothetical protein
MFRFFTFCLLAFVVLPAWAQESQAAPVLLEAKFNPRLLEQIEVDVLCSSGQLIEQVFSLDAGKRLAVTPESYLPGKTICQVRAQPAPGYSVVHSARSNGVSSADLNGCHFSQLTDDDEAYCLVSVTQDNVPLTVYKKWVGGSGEENDVQINLECESGKYSGSRFINEGTPGGWEIEDIDPEGILCNVSEVVRDTFEPDIIDCQGLWILPGKGEECTLLNTKIVKRIEMLNRYGKLIMIVLVLGVGLVAVRRFS